MSDLSDDPAAELGRHVEATSDGYVVQVAGSSGAEVSGRGCPVEVPDGEQETKPSCALACAGEADEAPDEACHDMETTRSARIARKETPEGEEQEGSDLGDDQEARLGRHVEATKDGLGDEQVAESSGKEAPGEEVPVEATDQEQGTQPSRAEICE